MISTADDICTISNIDDDVIQSNTSIRKNHDDNNNPLEAPSQEFEPSHCYNDVPQLPASTIMNLGHDAIDQNNDYHLACTYYEQAITVLLQLYHTCTNDRNSEQVSNITDAIATENTKNASSSSPSAMEYELATAYSHLGFCRMKLFMFEDAFYQYQQSLLYKRLYYNFYSSNDVDGTTSTDTNDGNTYLSSQSTMNDDESSSHHHKCQKEVRNINLDLAQSIEKVGEIAILLGDYMTAKRHYHEALDIKRLVYTKEQQIRTKSKSKDASVSTEQSTTTTILVETPTPALRTLESMKPTVYGYDAIQNSDIAHTYIQIGTICQHQHHYHKARNYYTSALSMYRTVYAIQRTLSDNPKNNKHGDTLDTFESIAVRTLPKTSNATIDKTSNDDQIHHVDIANTLAKLGCVNCCMGKYEYGKSYYDESISMLQQLINDCKDGIDKQSDDQIKLYTTTLDTILKESDREMVEK